MTLKDFTKLIEFAALQAKYSNENLNVDIEEYEGDFVLGIIDIKHFMCEIHLIIAEPIPVPHWGLEELRQKLIVIDPKENEKEVVVVFNGVAYKVEQAWQGNVIPELNILCSKLTNT